MKRMLCHLQTSIGIHLMKRQGTDSSKPFTTVFYHGISAGLFGRFSLDHALQGDGKCKFGWGVYVRQAWRGTGYHRQEWLGSKRLGTERRD